MQLRYYQEESVESVFTYFAEGGTGNPIIALPTGTGKSVVIAFFFKRAIQRYPNTRVMMLTHVKELIEQNYEKLKTIWPTSPSGLYSAGLRKKETRHPITYAGIGSVAKRAHEFGHIDLVFIDECHLVSPKGTTQYRNFINDLKKVNPHVKVIGLTATPFRLGQGMLIEPGGLFTDICYDATSRGAFNRMVREGFLAKLVPKATTAELDVSSVGVRAGEFVAKDLQAAVDQAEVTQAALDEVVHRAVDRKHWLVFASGIEHAEHIREMLNDMGVPTVSVHSKMSVKDRDQNIVDFKSGAVRALVNNGVLTTGFDFPGLDCIVMLRPTSSPSLWVQMLGRGTRPCEGKENCLVLDFAGNSQRLGPINDPVLPKKKGSKGKGVAPVRVCDHCGTINHASARFCDECGTKFPRSVKIKTHAGTTDLIAGDVMIPNAPIVEDFPVQGVAYSRHHGRKGTDTLKVTYQSGLRFFTEHWCLEHSSNIRHAHRAKWVERDPFNSAPDTIAEALERSDTLRRPETIRVHTNAKPYPKILNYSYPKPRATDNAPF